MAGALTSLWQSQRFIVGGKGMMTQTPQSFQEPEPLDAVDLFVVRSDDAETYRIGGSTTEGVDWQQSLTKRAARGLWFDLTRLLYPERSDQVIAQVSTMPSMPRFNTDSGGLTTWAFVTERPDGSCIISGWCGLPGWSVRLTTYEIYRFWATLDTALFPTGW